MSDWIEHNGGPQPVAKGVWVRRFHRNYPGEPFRSGPQLTGPHDCWKDVEEYQVLNQHLIDAALKRGIRLGLEAAAGVADHDWPDPNSPIRNLDPDTIAREAKPTA
ncbi:MAG: hypothetical protein INF00_09855 [Phenylobacterium sp.]|uniref:hypothetical protein n=1 Tax=Phenylobacterium sp. TaxID=1871053 RepID=UPI0025CDB0C8|nr:hypothetical protein [Phenylobacterium sp.]MCA3732655.1 hypothetical protein [Phenylobacterium sp.]